VHLEGNDVAAYRARFDLPPVETAPLIARTLVRTSLTAWGATELVDAAVLVVSEMVTNAVVHVGGAVALELRIERHGQEVHLALADGSSVRPLARELEDDDPHGRGIHLIEAVANRWETRDHQGGKQVWVALRDPLEAAPERE
jgi:anti-sigma regulatory factor (Ser/Thr protein kinase)